MRVQSTNADSLQPFIQLCKAQVESSWTSATFHLGVKSLHMRRGWKVLCEPVKNSTHLENSCGEIFQGLKYPA